jgi:transposase-like protein
MKATKRKVPSKTKRAQAFIESNPAASVNEVANRFGMTKQSVYALRNKMKKDGFVFPKRADQLASLAPATLEIEMFDFPDEVDETLDARALDYGKFIEGAEVMQMLKRVVQAALNNRDKVLAHDQAEAMDMIIHKIGRIVNGNPDVVDHWLDIAGYAKLVADRLEGRIR